MNPDKLYKICNLKVKANYILQIMTNDLFLEYDKEWELISFGKDQHF